MLPQTGRLDTASLSWALATKVADCLDLSSPEGFLGPVTLSVNRDVPAKGSTSQAPPQGLLAAGLSPRAPSSLSAEAPRASLLSGLPSLLPPFVKVWHGRAHTAGCSEPHQTDLGRASRQ